MENENVNVKRARVAAFNMLGQKDINDLGNGDDTVLQQETLSRLQLAGMISNKEKPVEKSLGDE